MQSAFLARPHASMTGTARLHLQLQNLLGMGQTDTPFVGGRAQVLRRCPARCLAMPYTAPGTVFQTGINVHRYTYRQNGDLLRTHIRCCSQIQPGRHGDIRDITTRLAEQHDGDDRRRSGQAGKQPGHRKTSRLGSPSILPCPSLGTESIGITFAIKVLCRRGLAALLISDFGLVARTPTLLFACAFDRESPGNKKARHQPGFSLQASRARSRIAA